MIQNYTLKAYINSNDILKVWLYKFICDRIKMFYLLVYLLSGKKLFEIILVKLSVYFDLPENKIIHRYFQIMHR